jgi:MalT-like TPR region
LQVGILIASGLVHGSRGNGREASARFASAARQARAGGFDGQAFQALGDLADSLWMQGDLDGAVAAARDALAQSRQSAFATRSNVGLALANLQGILTERGDLAEAAAVGREFMAFTRDAGVAWIVLDHYALRLAKSGRHEVAARLVGWNEAAVRAKDVRRQINEQRAYESNLSILRAKLSAAELERLMSEGAKMSEDEVCRLAVES